MKKARTNKRKADDDIDRSLKKKQKIDPKSKQNKPAVNSV
jgi:hypothetical protein